MNTTEGIVAEPIRNLKYFGDDEAKAIEQVTSEDSGGSEGSVYSLRCRRVTTSIERVGHC